MLPNVFSPDQPMSNEKKIENIRDFGIYIWVLSTWTVEHRVLFRIEQRSRSSWLSEWERFRVKKKTLTLSSLKWWDNIWGFDTTAWLAGAPQDTFTLTKNSGEELCVFFSFFFHSFQLLLVCPNCCSTSKCHGKLLFWPQIKVKSNQLFDLIPRKVKKDKIK